MKTALIFLTIQINCIWATGISWGRGNTTSRKKRSTQEYNLSYKEFLEQAEDWLGSNKIVNKALEIPCGNSFLSGDGFEGCFKIEVNVPGRSKSSKNKGEKNNLTTGEIDLHNLLIFSEPDLKEAKKYWDDGIEKITLKTTEPIKCEIVYFPVETIGMTMASDGSVSKSEIDSKTTSHNWKIGGKVKAETSKLFPVGSFSLTVNAFYAGAYSSVIREVTQETFSNNYPSSCTPSLINAGLLCHPITVFRIYEKAGKAMNIKIVDLPESLIPNQNQELFDKFTNCIDYLRSEDYFLV